MNRILDLYWRIPYAVRICVIAALPIGGGYVIDVLSSPHGRVNVWYSIGVVVFFGFMSEAERRHRRTLR
jgi:hypothetical protein